MSPNQNRTNRYATASFVLPGHVELPADALATLAGEFGLDAGALRRLPDVGITNAIYALGDDLILRVPRDQPGSRRSLEREAAVVPLAVAAGVRCPRLVRYDPGKQLLPTPYAIYGRIEGQSLEHEPGHLNTSSPAWEDVGRDLARLHAVTMPKDVILDPPIPVPGPEELLDQRVREGWLSPLEEAWYRSWLEDLAARGREAEPRLLRGDIQATNIMVGEDGSYRALIDWGDSRVDDRANDFAGVPLRVVPAMLAGYGTDGDEALRARIVRRHLQLGLLLLPRGAAPALSWAERSVSPLIEALRFFTAAPPGWEQLRPPSPSST